MNVSNRSRGAVKRYVATLLVSRWMVLFVTFVIIATFASGLKFLKFSNDYRVFFDKWDPQLQALEEIHNIYTDDDPVLFVITPKKGNVFSKDTLASVEWLTREAWKIPYIRRVDSLQNFQYSRAENDDLVVSDLYRNADSLSRKQIEKIRDVALADSQLVGKIINPCGTVTGVFATFHLPGLDRQKEVPEIMRHAEKLRNQLLTSNPNLDVRLAGAVVISNEFTEASSRDMAILAPLIVVLIAATLRLLLGSALTAIAALLVIALTLAGTMGMAGWLGFVISPASVIAPNVLLTVAVADSVHVLVDFLNDLGTLNVTHKSDPVKRARYIAIILSIEQTLKPIFITTLTTAIGFLSLNFSDSPPFRDLGNIVAMGVGLAFFLTVFFLPALLAVLPITHRQRENRKPHSQLFEKFARLVIRKRKPLTIVLAVVVAGLSAMIPLNELNDDVVRYFSEKSEFRQSWAYTTSNLTGLYTLEYSIRAKEPGGINDPEYLQVIERFAEWFASQPETLHVDSIVDIHKRLNKNMNGDDPDWYRLPDNKEIAAQYLLLYEMSLPPGLELNDRINIDKSASRFVVTVKDLPSNEMLDLERRADEWLEHNAPDYMKARAGSTPLMFAHIGQTNIQGMIEGTAFEFIVIALILMVALRSFRLGLLSLIPNMIPAAMAFGFWALIQGKINLGLSVVANMTLGIVVDDTVHFLSNYVHAERNLGKKAESAIRYTFRHVGKAMAVSTLVLSAGFGTLIFSSYELNAQMGMLTTITILFALFGDLLLLPSLLLFKLPAGKNSREHAS